MLTRIRPGVAVMDIKQEIKSCGLDALAQGDDIGQILAHTLALMLGTGLGRIDKQANTHCVQPHCFQVVEHIGNPLTILIVINGTTLLIFCKQGNITAHIPGSGRIADRARQQHASKQIV